MKKYFPFVFCLILFVSLFWCARIERQGRELSEKIIRLHITADSDEAEAQKLKLMVRDAVLAELTPLTERCADAESAGAVIQSQLAQVEQTAAALLRENGCSLPVSASLETESFGERSYDGFTLPAGDYRALRITIGSGSGKNWWCVVFPPLCMSAAVEQEDLSVFSPEEARLITDEGYVIKFKVLELIAWLKDLLKR